MDAMGMALAVRLLLNADQSRFLTELTLRHAAPESFFVGAGIRALIDSYAAGLSQKIPQCSWRPIVNRHGANTVSRTRHRQDYVDTTRLRSPVRSRRRWPAASLLSSLQLGFRNRNTERMCRTLQLSGNCGVSYLKAGVRLLTEEEHHDAEDSNWIGRRGDCHSRLDVECVCH
jgi:hypothetical protein